MFDDRNCQETKDVCIVTSICAKAMNSINRIRLIRNSLSKEVCQTIVQSLVISHLDYANAILIDLPDITMKKLRVQNIAARLVLGNESREENSKENLKICTGCQWSIELNLRSSALYINVFTTRHQTI